MVKTGNRTSIRIESCSGFRERMRAYAGSRGILLRVMFELTYECNFRCRHCYVPTAYKNRSKELKTRQVFNILDQLAELGCLYVGFTGGEPFMRSDFLSIVRYARRKGFEVIVYSNGSLIDRKRAGILSELALNKVDITIPSMKEAVFNSLTGVKGLWSKVFRAIDLLYKNGVNLGFKTCFLRGNETEIEEIRRFARSVRASHRFDNILSPRLDGSKEPYKYRGLKSAQSVIHSFSSGGSVIDTAGGGEAGKRGAGNMFNCGVGTMQAAITPFGELKMCVMINYPRLNILDAPVRDRWQQLKAIVSDIKPARLSRCDKCGIQAYCKWCPARGWLYNKKFTSCDPEICSHARRMAECGAVAG